MPIASPCAHLSLFLTEHVREVMLRNQRLGDCGKIFERTETPRNPGQLVASAVEDGLWTIWRFFYLLQLSLWSA
jgi:hypothetical protein